LIFQTHRITVFKLLIPFEPFLFTCAIDKIALDYSNSKRWQWWRRTQHWIFFSQKLE